MINLQELILLKTDIFSRSRVKLVRHRDRRIEYRDVIKDRQSLIEYQKEQTNDVFGKTDYLVSFIGQEGTKALLFGFFKVGKVEQKGTGKFYYELEELDVCSEYVDRIIIDWGNGTRAWHQDYSKQKKEVLEILPKGYIGNFPGLTDFVLDYSELKRLFDNSDSNRDWKIHLSSVNGVYMILDKTTGNQYIGSACGNKGIWQRWEDYAKTKHGDNKKLVKLFEEDNDYQRNLQYTVLQALPSNLTSKETVKIENLFKKKFGTKTHGLNDN
ncbi:MAG: GIY-YIG nuclease family protein [Bacteroidales bacterium]|jgi:hypothetical protein|nr:GIY-YIG nuclease family protein [Bacteroidales bacterium]